MATGTIPTLPLPRTDPMTPPDELAALRAEASLVRVTAASGEPAWLVTRHEAARSVLADPRFGVAMPGVPGGDVGEQDGSNDSLFQDPPGHTRLRRLVGAAFTPRRVADLRARADGLVGELLDATLARGGPVDLMAAVAFPLSITMIGELLGVPDGERGRFREWSGAVMMVPTGREADPAAGWQELSSQLDGLVRRKRDDPGDDLLSALIAVHDTDDGRLSHSELLTMAITLITAGYVTTATGAGVGTLLLVGHDRLRGLAGHPERVATAVDEVLRFQAAGGDLARVARSDVEVDGVPVRAGEKVLVSLAAANRDPRRFTDPDTFDVTRTDNPHLAFGHGAHHCLGAGLARLELRAFFGGLAARLPGLRLAVDPAEVRWECAAMFDDRWPVAVPVTW